MKSKLIKAGCTAGLVGIGLLLLKKIKAPFSKGPFAPKEAETNPLKKGTIWR